MKSGQLKTVLTPYQQLAMQYSPRNAIMYVSMVDAGTIELLREFGKTIVSSSGLVSHFEAVLSEERIASHYEARNGSSTRCWRRGFARLGIVRAGRRQPCRRDRICNGAMALRGDASRRIDLGECARCRRQRKYLRLTLCGDRRGDEDNPRGRLCADRYLGANESSDSIFYDITWTGVVGREPTDRERLVFNTVRDARDAAIAAVQTAFAAGRPIAGFEADDASRGVIRAAGFGEWFTHRTGHNIATEIHGSGAHLDNLETHDERLLLPFTCFSVEPGIYLPEFGVRSEIDMMTSADKAVVTGRIQTELLRI